MESCSVSTVSVWDEQVLGLDSDDSCITQWMYSMLLNYILKMVKMVHYMLSVFNHNKNIFLKGISVIFWIQKKISWVSHKWNTRTDAPLGSECAPRRDSASCIPNVPFILTGVEKTQLYLLFQPHLLFWNTTFLQMRAKVKRYGFLLTSSVHQAVFF